MVPSMTETLLECDVEVVGRTRFCIHPKARVKSINVVGGTKDLNWQKIKDLKADLLIVDKEENLPWMLTDAPLPVFVSHIDGLDSMPSELKRLAQILSNPKLERLGNEWQKIASQVD